MKYRILINRNHAVAGVIEALLLVALVAIIISTIQLIYIPQIMEQRESDHMDEVANQFSFLKAVIDLQSLMKEDVPISSPITLGSRELPYFVTAPAFGELYVYDRDYVDTWNIDVTPNFDNEPFPLTSIKYQANNRYFVRQTYVLEGGAIILKQPDGETMLVEPPLIVENKTTEVNINYTVPIIVGIPGKNATSGYKNCFIRTNCSDSDENWQQELNVSSINISTNYPTAWYNLLNTSLEDNVNYTQGSSYVNVTRKVEGKTINFYYKRIYIYVQISPGWIK